MKIWLVVSKGAEEDFGGWTPDIHAVCTTEDRANEIGHGLWGNTKPGLAPEVWIEQHETDVLISTEEG